MYECSDSGKLELILTTNTKKTYCDPNYCVLKPNHPCFMFLVLCLFYLSSSICVCHLSHGPFVGVPSSQVLPSYCTSTCARSCCTWRASCVDSNPKKNCYPQMASATRKGMDHLQKNPALQFRAFFKAVKVVLLQASALRKDPLPQDTH